MCDYYYLAKQGWTYCEEPIKTHVHAHNSKNSQDGYLALCCKHLSFMQNQENMTFEYVTQDEYMIARIMSS
jgi:hypothetical protein